MKKTPICWVNGRFIAQPEARVSPFDSGFLYGDGVYDTLRCYRNRLFQWKEHTRRLRENLRKVEIPYPHVDELRPVLQKLIAVNRCPDAVLRIQITRGTQLAFPPRPRFGSPTVFLTVRPVPHYPPRLYAQGATVSLVDAPSPALHGRPGTASRPGAAPFMLSAPKVKSTNFQVNLLARLRAARANSFEAVFVSGNRVLEGSMSNIFLVHRRVIHTPRLEGILPGVTRATVLKLARRLGIRASESACSVSQLLDADEAFLTSTTLEVMPIRRLRWNRRARTYSPHPVADALGAAYRKLVEQSVSVPSPLS